MLTSIWAIPKGAAISGGMRITRRSVTFQREIQELPGETALSVRDDVLHLT